MKKIKKILAVLCLTTVLVSVAVTASAAEPETPADITASTAAIGGGTADPCSDVIETKYRGTSDGHIQYRRWNATRGYWVDPDWITLE